ncbi:hypothetical protein CSKR_100711 [Clonorchis sinensis]|uniref:Uncharacterized protein n=1 Tax=Clonorchis sinensis TaxID=79923 RepID=A0A419PKW4_CLOSI|nr:hypothetical protein CSKR_100711 [Clonorchis sinensis]
MPPEESTRARILPGYPKLDRGSREAGVGFEPRTFRAKTVKTFFQRTTIHVYPAINPSDLETFPSIAATYVPAGFEFCCRYLHFCGHSHQVSLHCKRAIKSCYPPPSSQVSSNQRKTRNALHFLELVNSSLQSYYFKSVAGRLQAPGHSLQLVFPFSRRC